MVDKNLHYSNYKWINLKTNVILFSIFPLITVKKKAIYECDDPISFLKIHPQSKESNVPRIKIF